MAESLLEQKSKSGHSKAPKNKIEQTKKRH